MRLGLRKSGFLGIRRHFFCSFLSFILRDTLLINFFKENWAYVERKGTISIGDAETWIQRQLLFKMVGTILEIFNKSLRTRMIQIRGS